MFRLKYNRTFLKELAEVSEYYDGEGVGLGDKFLGEVDVCLRKLQTHPEAFASVHHPQHRRIVMPTFPYNIYYRITSKMIVLTRCYSTHRKPLY